jgi:mono/diheme cytochrome c family protein
MRFAIAFGALALLIVSGSTARAADGAEVYNQKCAQCHGEKGTADTPVGKAMKVPPLAGDADVQKMSADQIAKTIKENEKHPPPVKSLSDADIAAAAAYAKELAGK